MMKHYTLLFIGILSIPAFAQRNTTGLNSAPAKYLQENPKHFSVYTNEGFIELEGLPGETVKLQLVSLTGQTVRSAWASDDVKTLDVDGLNPGIYLLSVANSKGFKAVRKVYIN